MVRRSRLSNFGMIAGRFASLVVVPPQVAIVGAGRTEPRVLPSAASRRPAHAAAVADFRSSRGDWRRGGALPGDPQVGPRAALNSPAGPGGPGRHVEAAGDSSGVEHPHDTPPHPFMASPTFAHSSCIAVQRRQLVARWRRCRSDHKLCLTARNEALLALWPSPRDPTPPTCRLPARVLNGLDGINFFLAGMQAGFGPFVAVLLADEKWTQQNIGFVLSVSSLAGLLS